LKIYSHPGYDIDLGLLNLLHPFDGRKYSRIVEALRNVDGIEFAAPEAPIDDAQIDTYINPLLARLLKGKRYVLQALELPYLPLLPFSVIE